MEFASWNIVDDIYKSCQDEGHEVPKSFLSLALKHVYQHPKFGFDPNEALGEEEVARLTAVTKEKALFDTGPIMETMRMQALFNGSFEDHSELMAHQNRLLEAKVSPLIKEIVDSTPKTKPELDRLYQKIITSVVLRSGLGNPTNGAVLREAGAALRSVFPQTQLEKFSAQPSRFDKKAQLRELSSIVCGIRIFNWDGRKGGEGVEDLPAVLNEALEATMNNVEAARIYTAEKTDKFTAVVEKLLYTDIGMDVSEKERHLFKFSLVNIRQYQTYLTMISKAVDESSGRLASLDQDLLRNLLEIQKSLASKLAIPTEQVFPQFIRLSRTWQGFQEEMIVLSHLNRLNQNLHRHTQCLKKLPLKSMLSKLRISHAPTDDERSMQTDPSLLGKLDLDAFANCRLVSPGNHEENVAKLPYSLGGFCPVALVSGQGFLVPGNPLTLGALHYKDNYFVCSTKDRLRQFGENPDFFISAINRIVTENPCLGGLLRMHGDNEQTEADRSSAACQTSLHIVSPNRDPSYRWNEWDLRRDAAQLCAGIDGRRTHSAQTGDSRAVGNSGCQTAPPPQTKNFCCSSQRDTFTQTDLSKRKKSLVVGLKSASGSEVKHVLLEDLMKSLSLRS